MTAIDISDQIKVLQEYKELSLKYETIIYAVSHDLKGPLTNIQELIKILESIPKMEANEASSIISLLSLSVKKLRETIEELTEIKLKSNGSSETSEIADFKTLAEDTQLSLKSIILNTGAIIATDIKVSKVTLSKKNIRSIIYNLLSNALKYRAEDRTPIITVKTERLDGYIVLTVSDNGIGMEKDKQEMIFYQNTRLRDDGEGSGIGLFILKRMVEDIGGKVEVESTLGEGTKVTITF